MHTRMQVQEFGKRGIRCMAVARTDAQGQWQMLGLLTFLDPPRPDTRATLETALDHGVQTRMVCTLFDCMAWFPGRRKREMQIAKKRRGCGTPFCRILHAVPARRVISHSPAADLPWILLFSDFPFLRGLLNIRSPTFLLPRVQIEREEVLSRM